MATDVFAIPAGINDLTVKGNPSARVSPPLLLSILAGLVAGASLLPLVYLIIRAGGVGTKFFDILINRSTLVVLINSVGLAAAVTVTSVIIGVLLAWLTIRTDLPFRRFWSVVTPLPLALPSYVGAFTLVAALGPRGMLHYWIEPFGFESLPSIYGFYGSWLTLTLFTYPYVLLTVRAGLRGIDPSMEEAARSLGCNSQRIFREITLPNLRPSIHAGALLVALYTLSDFGAVSLLQFNSFTTKIYIQYTSLFDRSAAAVLSLLLVVITCALLALEYHMRGKAKYYRCGVGSARPANRIRLGRWRFPAILFCTAVVALSLVLPLMVIGFWLIRGVTVGDPLFWDTGLLLNSISVSGLAAVVAVMAAVPVVFLSIRYPRRLTKLCDRCSYTGHALPGIVIALALVFFSLHCLPFLYQTLIILIFAYMIRFLPEATGSIRAAMLQIDPRLEEAARNLGQSSLKALSSITLPLLKPGLLTGFALVFLTCMKELPATLLLSPTGFQTLATRIWGATEEAFYSRAAAPALALVIVAALSIWIVMAQEEKELYD